MPIVKVNVEMSDADKAFLTSTIQTPEEKQKALLLAERVRTIDQIKRLYAVVMGFALTTCITNAFLCARPIYSRSWEELSIVIAPVIVFSSIIALFYLGAERMLERKYLQPDSGDPSWFGLWLDLVSLGLTGIAFVVLANVFQGPDPGQTHDLAELRKLQHRFIDYLIAVYVLDVVLLAFQLPSVWHKKERSAHLCWIVINVAVACLLFWFFRAFSDFPVPYLQVSLVALLLALLHVARFLLDFCLAFDLYYPVTPKPPVPVVP